MEAKNLGRGAIGNFLQSFTFLYMNRLKLFFIYFFLIVVVGIFDLLYQTPVSLLFSIICPAHVYNIVENYNEQEKRGWYSRWWAIPSILASFVVPIILCRSFFYEPFTIPGASMSPYLDVGDFVLVKKMGYGTYGTFGISLVDTDISESVELQRGKAYVFYPPHKRILYIKRLIGKPGDSVVMSNGVLLINGNPVERKLLLEGTQFSLHEETLEGVSYKIKTAGQRFLMGNIDIVVPQGQYFFLGDNRDQSADSRMWGAVPSSNLVGEVVYVLKMGQ